MNFVVFHLIRLKRFHVPLSFSYNMYLFMHGCNSKFTSAHFLTNTIKEKNMVQRELADDDLEYLIALPVFANMQLLALSLSSSRLTEEYPGIDFFYPSQKQEESHGNSMTDLGDQWREPVTETGKLESAEKRIYSHSAENKEA